MYLEIKSFLELMRRASKCRYKTVLQVNHVLMQSYSIDVDSDEGMHYALFIPMNESSYEDPFYDLIIEYTPSDVLKTYSTGHKKLLELKKEQGGGKIKISEELVVQEKKGRMEFKFLYYLKDELVCTETWSTPYPVDQTRPEIENIANTLDNAIERIKPGGACVLIDGTRTGIFRRATESSDIYYHTVKINGTKVQIPLLKSMFLGNKQLDECILSIQETVLKNIYLWTLMMTRKGLSECFYGYIMRF